MCVYFSFRNSYTNNMTKTTPAIVRSISESLTKSITSANKAPTPNQQDVVNLFSKRGLTISTVIFHFFYIVLTIYLKQCC